MGKQLLITNEHVLRDWKSQQFGHQFQGCDKIFGLGQPLALEGDPVDAAICIIGDQIWKQYASGAKTIPAELVAERHEPVPGLHTNYFLLVYAPARTESVDPKNGVPLSLPPGLSGSLVWNTRRMECDLQKRTWTPDLAQVTGILCSWIDKRPIVIATRIEVVREFLKANTS